MKCFESYCADTDLWVLKYYSDEVLSEHIDQVKSEGRDNYDERCLYIKVYYRTDTQEMTCNMMYLCDDGINWKVDCNPQDFDWLLRDVQKQVEGWKK